MKNLAPYSAGYSDIDVSIVDYDKNIALYFLGRILNLFTMKEIFHKRICLINSMKHLKMKRKMLYV